MNKEGGKMGQVRTSSYKGSDVICSSFLKMDSLGYP